MHVVLFVFYLGVLHQNVDEIQIWEKSTIVSIFLSWAVYAAQGTIYLYFWSVDTSIKSLLIS